MRAKPSTIALAAVLTSFGSSLRSYADDQAPEALPPVAGEVKDASSDLNSLEQLDLRSVSRVKEDPLVPYSAFNDPKEHQVLKLPNDERIKIGKELLTKKDPLTREETEALLAICGSNPISLEFYTALPKELARSIRERARSSQEQYLVLDYSEALLNPKNIWSNADRFLVLRVLKQDGIIPSEIKAQLQKRSLEIESNIFTEENLRNKKQAFLSKATKIPDKLTLVWNARGDVPGATLSLFRIGDSWIHWLGVSHGSYGAKSGTQTLCNISKSSSAVAFGVEDLIFLHAPNASDKETNEGGQSELLKVRQFAARNKQAIVELPTLISKDVVRACLKQSQTLEAQDMILCAALSLSIGADRQAILDNEILMLYSSEVGIAVGDFSAAIRRAVIAGLSVDKLTAAQMQLHLESNKQMQELALGLNKSGHKNIFIVTGATHMPGFDLKPDYWRLVSSEVMPWLIKLSADK